MSHNARASNFDTHLLDLPDAKSGRKGGVPGREQFKHVVFGPGRWREDESNTFPAVRDRIEEGDWEGAQEAVDVVAEVLRHAAWKLVNN